MKTIDLRTEEMRDFHASKGNTFSDHALRCAVDGRVLLTVPQAYAVEAHLEAVGTPLDSMLWGYCGRYYEIGGGYIDIDEDGRVKQAYWLVSAEFDPFIPAPDGSDDLARLEARKNEEYIEDDDFAGQPADYFREDAEH